MAPPGGRKELAVIMVQLLSRYMLALSVVPAVLQFIGFIFLPESPRWLLQSGRTQEAHDVLGRIRGGQSADVEYQSIKASIEDEAREAGGGERAHQSPPRSDADVPAVTCSLVPPRMCRRSGYSADPSPRPHSQGADGRLRPADVPAAERDKHGHVSRPLPCCHPRVPPQSRPVPLSRYYSATILQMAGIRDDKRAIWLTAATSGCNFVFTLLGVWLVDRLGRRKLTLGSLFGRPGVGVAVVTTAPLTRAFPRQAPG